MPEEINSSAASNIAAQELQAQQAQVQAQEQQQVQQQEQQAELESAPPPAEPTQVSTSETLSAQSFNSDDEAEQSLETTLQQVDAEPTAAQQAQANVSAEEALGLAS